MMKFLVLAAAIGLSLVEATVPRAASAVVLADPQTTFYFTGTCIDCAGQVQAELTVKNYSLGDQVTVDNFVTFHYDGSNLYHAFTIGSDDNYTVGGFINGPLPSTENFVVFNGSDAFLSTLDGSWYLGANIGLPADIGTDGTFAAVPPTTVVPEPVALTLLATGLVGTLVGRRRRPE